MHIGAAISALLHVALIGAAMLPSRPQPLAPFEETAPVEVALLSAAEFDALTSRPPASTSIAALRSVPTPPNQGAPDTPPVADIAPPPPPPRPQRPVDLAIAPPPPPDPLDMPPPESTPPPPSDRGFDVAPTPQQPEVDRAALADRPVERADLVPNDRVRAATEAPALPTAPRGSFDAPSIDIDSGAPPEPPRRETGG